MKYFTLLIIALLLYACGNGGRKQNTISDNTTMPTRPMVLLPEEEVAKIEEEERERVRIAGQIKPLEVGAIIHDRLDLPVIDAHREFIENFQPDSITHFNNVFGRDRIMDVPINMRLVDSILTIYTPTCKVDSLYEASVNHEKYIAYGTPPHATYNNENELYLAYEIFRKDIIWEILYLHSGFCRAEDGNFLGVLELMDKRIMQNMYDRLISAIENKIEYVNQRITVNDPQYASLYMRDDKTLLQECHDLLSNIQKSQRQWERQTAEDKKLYRSSTIFTNGNWPITMYSRYSPYIVRATFLLDVLQGISDEFSGQARP